MPSVTVDREIGAPPEVVFEAITDHEAYPEFTPIRKAVLERPGEGAPNGVGAIRALHLVGPPIRERITVYEPPRRLAYEVLSGVPLRSQEGTVSLEPAGAGCAMSYRIDFEPLIPLSGAAVGLAIKTAIGRLTALVGAEAERRAAG